MKFVSFADWDGIEAIQAWKSTPEFKERIGRVKEHVSDFTAVEAELTTRIESATPVA